ncbi:hypothetical protein [Capnocytophaga sputigena]|jgi:hypothetical protein|uniref:hypothetical protein n=1 Tax=Capnocytophaga sputigena TaxID=1019 RepID=UPI0028D3414E|nr:hypothetical protein [Capnocytophaga sputigena]
MNLDQFLDNLKKHLDILREYVKSQNKFISEEEERFDKLAWKSAATQVALAKKRAENYRPNSIQQKRIAEIKKLLNQYHKDSEIKPNELSLLMTELEYLENGYSENDITIQTYNSYYEFSENNFTAMFAIYNQRGTLILTYSIIEFYLNTLYKILSKKNTKKNSKVEKVKNQLEKDCKVERKLLDSTYWDSLDIIRILRNYIVHNEGIFSKSNEDVKKIKKLKDKITLFEDKKSGATYIIALSEDFFTMTFENILKFFEDLVKSKQNKANKLTHIS